MLDDFRIVATCCAMMVGLLVVSANPARRLNRAFFVFSCFVAAWLFSQWQAGRSDDGLWWVRVACAFAVGVVLLMWFVKETAANPECAFGDLFRKIVPWGIVGLGLVVICFTEYFIPAASTSERRLYGWGYYAYVSGISGLVLSIFGQTLLQLRTLSGSRRLELQQLLLGSIAAAVAVVLMMILGASVTMSGRWRD